jgi:hypothetical protein
VVGWWLGGSVVGWWLVVVWLVVVGGWVVVWLVGGSVVGWLVAGGSVVGGGRW